MAASVGSACCEAQHSWCSAPPPALRFTAFAAKHIDTTLAAKHIEPMSSTPFSSRRAAALSPPHCRAV